MKVALKKLCKFPQKSESKTLSHGYTELCLKSVLLFINIYIIYIGPTENIHLILGINFINKDFTLLFSFIQEKIIVSIHLTLINEFINLNWVIL